jgi:putative sigma-54 modulation protein
VQINISARHGELSPATQDKIRDKIGKLPRYFDRLTAIHVTANLEHRDAPSVEVRVLAEHSHDFVATERSTELIAALDSALHKIEQQLRKHKEKLRDNRVTGIKHLDAQRKPSAE